MEGFNGAGAEVFGNPADLVAGVPAAEAPDRSLYALRAGYVAVEPPYNMGVAMQKVPTDPDFTLPVEATPSEKTSCSQAKENDGDTNGA